MTFTFKVWRFAIVLTVADISWEFKELEMSLLVSWGE